MVKSGSRSLDAVKIAPIDSLHHRRPEHTQGRLILQGAGALLTQRSITTCSQLQNALFSS